MQHVLEENIDNIDGYYLLFQFMLNIQSLNRLNLICKS